MKLKNKTADANLKRIVGNNWFAVKYIFKISPVYTIAVITAEMVEQIVVFFEHTYQVAYIVDCIQYKRPFSCVLNIVLIIFSIVVVKVGYSKFRKNIIVPKAEEKIKKQISLDLYRKAASLDLECYDNPEFYNDFVWAMSEAETRMKKVIDTMNLFVGSIALIILNGAYMILRDVFGLLFVASSFIFTLILNFVVNRLNFNIEMELKPLQRRRDYINRVFYLNDYSKEIRLSDVKEKLIKDFEKNNRNIIGLYDKKTKKLAVLSYIRDFLCNTLILDGLYVIYLLFMTIVMKAVSYGSMVGLFSASRDLKSYIEDLTTVIPEFQKSSLYIDKIRHFLEYETKVKSGSAAVASLTPKTLQLKNVSFAYSKNGGYRLKDINITIKPNEKVAFVGYNGAGKTTLIKLIMRLYDATEGDIVYDGTNIKDYNLYSYRNCYGAVFQDFQLFSATLAENVAMDTSDIEYGTVTGALDASGFGKRLAALENGLDTQITNEFDETGVNLSLGEAQKVAIARVLYKKCPIIIMDEPSSALDPIAKYNLNKTIMDAANNKTVIFISHRLSTTRMADKIYMLENGSIIEQGSHDELMTLNGKYAEMFNLQAEKYKLFQSEQNEGAALV